MITEKHCPKCGGNIYLDRDSYGWYEECLQCSYTRDLETIVEVPEEPEQIKVKAKRKTKAAKN